MALLVHTVYENPGSDPGNRILKRVCTFFSKIFTYLYGSVVKIILKIKIKIINICAPLCKTLIIIACVKCGFSLFYCLFNVIQSLCRSGPKLSQYTSHCILCYAKQIGILHATYPYYHLFCVNRVLITFAWVFISLLLYFHGN